MPRSSFSLNPLLKVSRPVSACSRCRAAKVKCDGKLPACTACEKAGRENECSAANDQFARGKERSYVAALELRIEKLERRLQYAKTRKASLAFDEPDMSILAQQVDRRDSLAKIKAAIHRKAARSRENSDVNSIVSDFGFLSVSANTRDFEATPGNMTFARLVLTAATNGSLPEPNPQFVLPPRQAAHALVQFYLVNIFSLLPFFSETALLNILDDIYQQDGRFIKDSDYWLFYLVLAIASASQSKSIYDEHYSSGLGYISKALEFAENALAPGFVTQIQSLLLLTQYSMLDPAHFDSWHLIGFTSRAVVDLGLHQDPPVSSLSDKAALDMRRKIFYSVYSLDRAISMVHARTFSFTDDATNVAFPATSMKDSSQVAIATPQSFDSALLLFQLRRAQSFWYQELYQSHSGTPLQDPIGYVWQMCLEMREWGESLPATLSPAIRQMFEQELRYSYVYCISPSGRVPQISDYHRTIIFEYSIAYLDTMHAIVQNGWTSGFYTYHDALKVYFMATQLLAVLWAAENMLLTGAQVPVPMQRPGGPPPPPVPRYALNHGMTRPDNLRRSLYCLERVGHTLGKFGERWEESAMLKLSFEGISTKTIKRLAMQRDAQEAALDQPSNHFHTNGQMPMAAQNLQQQPQQSQQQQAREMRWVGVNVAQMRGRQ